MDILLIPGLWLDASAWDDVLPGLAARGHRPHPLTPPATTLEDQVGAVVSALDAASEPALVVGHSAASTLAWIAADARPGKTAGVAFVGGFPAADGRPYAPFFEPVDGELPFPGWAALPAQDAVDLDDAARARVTALARPVPEAVVLGTVRLGDPARYAVPATVVCPEFSPAEATGWIEAGDVPELAAVEHLSLVDIDSGHWPMFTQPDRLAALLADIADGLPPVVARG